MKKLLLCLLPALLALVLPASASAKPGQLDRNFGGTGKVTAFLESLDPALPAPHTYGQAPQVHLAWAPKGRIVAAAGSTLFGYLRNGRPNRRFGEDGRLRIDPVPGSAAEIAAVKFDSRGRILVAGTVRPSDWSAAGFVTRYLADGRPDSSFGNGGTVVTTLGLPAPPAPSPSEFPQPPAPPNQGPIVRFLGLALDAHGRPVLSGTWTGDLAVCYPFTSYSSRNSGFLARLNENGSVDTGFGNDGVLIDPSREASFSPLPDDGGVLFVGATVNCFRGPRPSSDLERATEAGQADPGFGSGGRLTFPFADRPALARDRFGRILMLGDGEDPVLRRLTPRGTSDPYFGRKGSVPMLFEGAAGPGALAVDRRGRPLIAVSSRYADDRAAFLLLRRRRDGGIDRSFWDLGQARTYFGGDAFPQQVLAGGDSKILVGGVIAKSGSYRIALARYDAR